MKNQLILWTALPHGVTNDNSPRRLRVSVFVSPRLNTTDGEELSLFPDFVDWPAHLQPGEVTFMIQPITGEAFQAKIVSPPPDSKLWRALFPPTSFVAPHDPPDMTNRVAFSYQAGPTLASVQGGYQQVLDGTPVHLPDQGAVRDAFPDLHRALTVAQPLQGFAADETNLVTIRNTLTAVQDQGTLQGMHASLAGAVLRPPAGAPLRDYLATVSFAARRVAQSDGSDDLVQAVPATDDASSHFAALRAFHLRPDAGAAEAPPPPPDPAKHLDFHQALNALADYPDLMRRLGLVIDLELPDDLSIPPGPSTGDPVGLQVLPSFAHPLEGTVFSPLTIYIREGDVFAPAAANREQPEYVNGLVNLALPDIYDLLQVDVDGAGLKLIGMTATQVAQIARDEAHPEAPDSGIGPGGVPDLRTSGIWLARRGFLSVMSDAFIRAKKNNALLAPDSQDIMMLTAEDVTRGYRFDVFDESVGGWRSLHRRQGRYTFKNHPDGELVLDIADEGTSQPTVTQPRGAGGGPPDGDADLYIHESLFHWQGWSLSAPRPGKTILDTEPVEPANAPLPGGFQLEVHSHAQPGTLPRLRFGRRYRFRARAVDLAGNSLTDDEAIQAIQTLELSGLPAPVAPGGDAFFVYRRFEPVPGPQLVLRERATEGESLQRLVIRSNFDRSAPAYAAQVLAPIAAAHAPDRVVYSGVNERHVAPPKASLTMVEMLGLLDASFGTGTAFQQTYNIARKEKGRLSDTFVVDTATGTEVSIPVTGGIDPATGNAVTRPAVEIAPDGSAVHHEPALALPYLPDPLAAGATFVGLPGAPSGEEGQAGAAGGVTYQAAEWMTTTWAALPSVTHVPFDGNWPEHAPFRLQLSEPPPDPAGAIPPPAWDPGGRVLTVFLPKAAQATVRLSSYLALNNRLDVLNLLGLWQWLLDFHKQKGVPTTVETQVAALRGAIWLLTPFSELHLVHAVQQPLMTPVIITLATTRELQATHAYIGATVPIDRNSTGKVDMLAAWQETLDLPDEPGPRVRSVKAHVFEVPVHLPDPVLGEPPPDPGVVPIATFDDNQNALVFQAQAPDDESGRNFLSRQEFGDTKHRTVTYQVVATSRFREYFPVEIAGDPAKISLTSAPVEANQANVANVLSSARPPAPQVVYALPVFGWQRDTGPSGKRRRIGGGVRVYLERPWFASGDGELLGVVLAQAGNYPPDPASAPFVTHWGFDPIWRGKATHAAPQLSNFVRATRSGQELALADLPQRVDVAGHSVQYDDKRKLWYSDIQIDAGPAYFPFVRLALARYQPDSLPGCELSGVVLADFVQLAPDRTVTLVPLAAIPGQPARFAVTISGITYARSSIEFEGFELGHFGPSSVELSVQERMPGADETVGWTTPADAGVAAQVVTLAATFGPDGASATWSGQIALPAQRAPGQFRLVIREFEDLATEARPQPGTAGFGDLLQGHPKGWLPARRLVFAETIVL